MRITVLTLTGLLLFSGSSQPSSEAAPYNVEDAYQIYSLLLPHEQSFDFAKGTLVIQQETVPGPEPSAQCLSPEAAQRFKEAVADYSRIKRKHWLLQRQFQIEKPYEIVSLETIQLTMKEAGWDGFYKRYPNSGGIFTMSAVGFNKEKTRAVLYSGSSCNSLCGRWSFDLLEKRNGTWRPVDGVRCTSAS
jgi:hypothetical protein